MKAFEKRRGSIYLQTMKGGKKRKGRGKYGQGEGVVKNKGGDRVGTVGMGGAQGEGPDGGI